MSAPRWLAAGRSGKGIERDNGRVAPEPVAPAMRQSPKETAAHVRRRTARSCDSCRAFRRALLARLFSALLAAAAAANLDVQASRYASNCACASCRCCSA